ncbi:GDP-mannose 4,6-dehydratase [Acidobacteriota bacterium]
MPNLDRRFWSQRNVFVTGASGLLGSWLVKKLVEMQANVTVLVRDWVPASILISDDHLDAVNAVRGNLEDFELVKRTLNEYEIESVLHLGAQPIVRIANRNPLSTFHSNIHGTWNVLEACRLVDSVKRVVAASSDKAYGSQDRLPYDETMPLQGRHPYDVSKSCADLIARSYFETFDVPVCVTRCGNFFGGGDLNFNRIIPETIRSVFQGERPVIRSDGSYIRDYIYIEDAVSAYLFLAQKMDDSSILGEAFNFSTESQLTVREIVDLILELMNRSDLKPEVRDKVKHEIKNQYLSAEKARKILGWSSKYTLRAGLEKTIAWYEEFFRRQRND